MTRYVVVILRTRLRAWRNRVARSRRALLGLLLSVLLSGVVGLLLGFAVHTLTRALADSQEVLGERLAESGAALDLATLLAAIPSAVFTLAFILLFFFTFGSLLGVLYLDAEMPRLLTAPVPTRAVFAARFLEAAVRPTLSVLAFGLPVLVGYGLGRGYGAAYFLLSLLLLLLLPLAPLGLSAIASLLLVRVMPARRAQELLRVLGTLIGVGIWLSSQAWGSAAEDIEIDPGRIDVTLAESARGLRILTELNLPGRAVEAAARGDVAEAILASAAVLALGLGLVLAGGWLAERLYLAGWARAQGGGRTRARREGRRGPARRGWLARLARPQAAALARKDWRIVRRDLRGLARVVWPLALAAIWTWQALRAGGEVGPLPDAVEWRHYLAGPIAIFAVGGVAQQLAMEGISRDKHSVYLLLSAPITPRQIALGKGLCAYLPTLLAGLLLVGGFAALTAMPPLLLAINLALVAVGLLGQTAISLAVGAASARFDWTDPQQLVGGGKGCASALATMGFVAALLALGLAPSLLAALVGLPAWLGLLGPLFALGLSAAVVFAGGRAAAEAFGRIEP